jgi:hypothetical protein
MELPPYVGTGILAFVVKQGAILSSKVRRTICDEAKGTSGEYIASAVYHNYPDSKRWVDTISQIKNEITDEQYHDLNESLGLSHEDAIFLSVKPDTFTVTTLVTELITGWIYDTWTSSVTFVISSD